MRHSWVDMRQSRTDSCSAPNGAVSALSPRQAHIAHQHTTCPFVRSPHTWPPPADSTVNVFVDPTVTEASPAPMSEACSPRLVVSPTPNCPFAFWPLRGAAWGAF